MNNVPDEFFDFVMNGGWDLLFPEDEDKTCKCPKCGRVIKGSDKVKRLDRETVQCPTCNEGFDIGLS